MNLRPRQMIGTIPWDPDIYGRSQLGNELEFWRPQGTCKLLVFAGIHGEEPETTFALSRALRQLSELSPHCAVVLAANPDGLSRGTRGNARGVDLNRNFPTVDVFKHRGQSFEIAVNIRNDGNFGHGNTRGSRAKFNERSC